LGKVGILVSEEKMKKALKNRTYTGITELVIEYVKRYPETSTRALARLLYDQNNLMFKDCEHARVSVQRVRGLRGKAARAKNKDIYGDYYTPEAKLKMLEEVPATDMVEWTPYFLDCDDLFCLFDVHVPYHDKKAVDAALEYAIKNGYENLLIGGDFMDCYQESRFIKDPRRRDVAGEIEMVNSFLDLLRKIFPGKIVYKYGNHEERHENLFKIKAPELLSIEEFRLDVLLNFFPRKIIKVDDQRIIKFDKLNILHGHEYKGGANSPIGPARSLYLKAGANAVCGHFHKTNEFTDPILLDRIKTCWTAGCLCELHPEYMRLNKHNHGFMGIKKDENGFHVENKRIIKGRIV
jgi:hypothetical protein